jgi:hypothetical protein
MRYEVSPVEVIYDVRPLEELMLCYVGDIPVEELVQY